MIHKILKSRKKREQDHQRIAERKVAEKLGRAGLEDLVRYLRSPWRVMWSNFLARIFRGLGFLVGATVILTVVVFVLVKVLGNLPWVGEWFARTGEWFQVVQMGAENLAR